LAGLNINTNTALLNKYSAALKSLKVPTLTGFTCHNCFAYVGASLKVALTCTVGGALNTCHFALAGGGGAQLNLDLRLENPTLSGDTGDVLLWNATSYATLYSNPAAFLKIKARPFLFTRLNGHLAATGTASLTASFNSSVGVQIVASSPVSIGNADAGLSGHLSMKRPTWASTLQVVDATLEASFTPLVMWDFEVGEVVSILGKNTGFTSSITAGTAISARYNYIERAPTGQRELLISSSSCSSNHRVTVSASLQGINEKLILQGSATTLNLLSAYLNTGDQLAFAALPGNTCISGPSPSTTPTPGPQDASQALGLSNLNGTERQLSTGAIAIVVLLPLLFLVFAVVLLRNWCKKKGADSLPSCLPLHCRQRASDCFVSRRRDSQAQINQRRLEAEERDATTRQAALDDMTIANAYERSRGTSVASMHMSDIVPNPINSSTAGAPAGVNLGLPLPVSPRRISVPVGQQQNADL